MRPLDAKDATILANRIALYDKQPGPRVGDVLRMADGTLRRFTHDWDDTIQITVGNDSLYGASFYFGDGYMSFSGGLAPARPKSKMVATGEVMPMPVWFFHENWRRANNGVNANFPARVFEEKESD